MKQCLLYSLLILLFAACQKGIPIEIPDPLIPQRDSLLGGYINEVFSDMDALNWNTPTSGASVRLENGTMVVKMSGTTKYRGDFKKIGGAKINLTNFPIIAVKMRKPPKSNCFFDTNLGAFNNRNNTHTVIKQADGNIYYWDLSKGTLGTNLLPMDSTISLSTFQFKVADVELTADQRANNEVEYPVYWVKSFISVDQMRSELNIPMPPSFIFSTAFNHPGLLHSNDDLSRIALLVSSQKPIAYICYQLFAANSRSSYNYTMAGPFTKITRSPSVTVDGVAGGTVKTRVENDFLAAYYNAIMFRINGDVRHANKAIEILDAYANTTTGIVGGDAELNGLYGFIVANAGEIIRYSNAGWPEANAQQFGIMLQNVFYPTLQNFRPDGHGNWDIICMKALLAIAIYSEDRDMVGKVVDYFYHGEGNGSIDQYVVSADGQLQESNRDQPHTMLALGSLAELAEMALKQGVDLYSASNNALMRGYEYTAAYNLGNAVPYINWYDYQERNYQDYTPEAISTNGRGQFRSVFEIAYNHYVARKGMSMPNTSLVLQQIRPENAPFGADHPGYGSLLFNSWE